jgi:hypothetical protein
MSISIIQGSTITVGIPFVYSTDKMVDPIENLNDGFQELDFLMYLSLSTFVLYSVFSSLKAKKQHDGIREPPLPYCHYDNLHPSNSYFF